MEMRMTRSIALAALVLAAGVAPAFAQGGGGGGRPAMGPPLQLTSTGITDVGTIPDKYTCSPDGKAMTAPANMTSPPVAWTNAPAGTKSFVLLLHDPMRTRGNLSTTSRTG